MMKKPTVTSTACKVQSVGEHLSEPMIEGSLPEPRRSDTTIRENSITTRANCFFGYQFEFSDSTKASRIEALLDLGTWTTLFALMVAWVTELPLLANGSKVTCLLNEPEEGCGVILEKGDP